MTINKLLVDFILGRHGGLMVIVLNSGVSGPGSSPVRTLCCVLGQDTSPSQCLSPPRCKDGYWRI